MATKNEKSSPLTQALLETASDMRDSGILDNAAYEKITMRHLGVDDRTSIQQLTGEEIRKIREKAHMSQAVFAHYLNLTTGYLSQLERGSKRATGAALVLLNLIQEKGIEAILVKPEHG